MAEAIDNTDSDEKPPTMGEDYMPRIGRGLEFWNSEEEDTFEVKNIWVHENGTTYIRYVNDYKSLCEPAEAVRENFEDGIWEVTSEP